jgi:hypothetical protein
MIPGVIDVISNSTLGSLTIKYGRGLEAESLISALRERGIDVPCLQEIQSHMASPKIIWKDLIIAGASLHILLDVLVYGLAARSFLRR